MTMMVLRKEARFATLPDALAAVETFAEHVQLRHVRVQQPSASYNPHVDATAASASPQPSPSPPSASSTTTTSAARNAVVLECENAPACKWFVRLAFNKSERLWKISSMNPTHHRNHCNETTTTSSSGTNSIAHSVHDDMLRTSAMTSATSLLPAASAASAKESLGVVVSGLSTNHALATLGGSATTNATLFVGMTLRSWKDAMTAIRALASESGRRAVAEKPTQLALDGRVATVRRAVCQNHRNSQCPWAIALEESASVADEFTVLSLDLVHSSECLETCNFSTRTAKAAATAAPSAAAGMTASSSSSAAGSRRLSSAPYAPNSAPSQSLGLMAPPPSASLLVDDVSQYQLTHDMRWGCGKEATKAVADFALVVQRKRAMLCKRNNGGSNKKYVCSDESCLWFVQLVKGWKDKTWKISAMNLKHSDTCVGGPKPTARQLAEMRFFRQAVVTHSKSNGKLLTDNFLFNSASGIAIPRGMAYRAQRMVVATSTDDLTESYKFIPSLFDALAAKNPGSVVTYDRDAQQHFVRAFVMPHAATLALASLQPVFGIELLTYDTVSYTGSLALLVGRDGNFASQVLAFALVPNGELEHMKWFLSLCKTGGVRFDNCTVFCSHSENGLLRAVAHETRNTKVLFCVRSLLRALSRDKTIPPLGPLEDIVWELQRQETEDSFVRTLQRLESLNAPAASFLQSMHPKNWAAYANRTTRLYEWASTRADEAIAGSDIECSDEAPFDLVYTFLAFIMDGVFKKSQLAQKLTNEPTVLTPAADALYRRAFDDASAFTVRICDEQVGFTWRIGARPKVTHRVDLALRTCTCGYMQQIGIPCAHFVVVAQHFRNEPALLDGFDPIYKAATYADANRSVRVEIPAAEDLHKDHTLLPVVSLRGAKYKKRVRAAAARGTTEANTSSSSSNALGDDGQSQAKTPRLDFDPDVVSRMSDFV